MKDYKLKKQDANLLQQLLLTADRKTSVNFDQAKGEMTVTYSEKTKRKLSLNCTSTTFTLDEIDPNDCKLERDILIREYEMGHEVGKHWDLLRWNVSKWFLAVQTIFVVGAAKGLLIMQEYCSKLYINPNLNTNLKKYDLLFAGLVGLSIVNIFLCSIWLIRNVGIHAWHKASIKRLLLIEADPRLRNCLQLNTSILQNMKFVESFPWVKQHSTGDLECWGPPVVFIFLWIVVTYLATKGC